MDIENFRSAVAPLIAPHPFEVAIDKHGGYDIYRVSSGIDAMDIRILKEENSDKVLGEKLRPAIQALLQGLGR